MHEDVRQIETRARQLLVAYQETRDVPTLSRAAALYRRVADLMPRRAAGRADCMADMSVALHWLSRDTGEVGLLWEAMEAAREAASLTADTTPAFVDRHNNLSLMLAGLSEHMTDVSLLRDAVEAAQAALGALPDGHPGRTEQLMHLGEVLRRYHEWTGDLSAIRAAVRCFRDALGSLPPGQPRRPACLVDLSMALRSLYERTGDVPALKEAVRFGRAAVAETQPDSAYYEPSLAALCNALRHLSERSPDPAVLTEAEQIARRLVEASAPGHLNHGIACNVLALILERVYWRSGELAHLRRAVQAARNTVDAAGLAHPHVATYKMNLVGPLRTLAEATGDVALAAEAVAVGRDALVAFPHYDPERAKNQAALSIALVLLAELRDDKQAATEAVQLAEEALAAIPRDHANHAWHLTTLINALAAAYHHTGTPLFLERALHVARDALASTSFDHPERALCLINLSSVVLRAARQSRTQKAELAEAVRLAREAVTATVPGFDTRAAALSNLGDALELLGEQNGETTAAHEALSNYTAVAHTPQAPAALRIRAAQRAARLALASGDTRQAMKLAEVAVDIVPQLAFRDVERASRERRLRVAHALGATVAATAIAHGDPARAVELLEQTRGLVIADTLDTRSDLTALREHSAELAFSFDALRRDIDALDHEPAPRIMTSDSVSDLGARHRNRASHRTELNRRWEEALTQIRRRPGLEDFLRPPSIHELRKQAADGPIVFVAAHATGSHALIVRDDPDTPVVALELHPDATESAVIDAASRLRRARHTAADRQQPARQRRQAQQDILDVLGWVWDTLTEPVLRHLGRTSTPSADAPWPRIWWCPIGPVALLPLHAAGHHGAAPRCDTVMDRVISSYTPTIRALAHVRARPPAPPSAVVVAVPDAPYCPPLAAADLEARALRDYLPDATVLPADGDTTSHDGVVEVLQRHSIVHLACHGVTNWADPAESRLVLHDHLVHPLTLRDITRLDLDRAEVAYLSACSTTDTHPLQIDEATQLTSAFQLAGFRNVIGTLWPITDQAAASFARDVYGTLTDQGCSPAAPERAAHALHHAVRHQRDRTPALPTRWAAYIHYGI
ncbi:CHAT domain-containing protein [Streptomyces sp. NPDC005803]|uniref:CHAT domain-containing protein n=1 Tax=Streptomyces sp. NPDC005803 TaxID=3154297 RepID=UPI003407A0CE